MVVLAGAFAIVCPIREQLLHVPRTILLNKVSWYVSWQAFWLSDGKKSKENIFVHLQHSEFICLLSHILLFVLTHPVRKSKSFDVIVSRWIVKRHSHSQLNSKEPFPNSVEQLLAGKRNYWQWINVPGGVTSEDIELSWKCIILVISFFFFFLFCNSSAEQALLHPALDKHIKKCCLYPWRSQSRWQTYVKIRKVAWSKERNFVCWLQNSCDIVVPKYTKY